MPASPARIRTHMVPNIVLILVLFFSLVVWLLVITVILLKAYSTYRTITEGIGGQDVAAILSQIKKHLKEIDGTLTKSQKQTDALETAIRTHIQKVGFVRYNPFGNTGGDQSFCLCLLDDLNSGILITSLHAREQTRLYTKEIVSGKPVDDSQLSKEEQTCLHKAIKRS